MKHKTVFENRVKLFYWQKSVFVEPRMERQEQFGINIIQERLSHHKEKTLFVLKALPEVIKTN